MPFTSGADRGGGMPEDGILVLPGVPGPVPGLHRPLSLLQIPPGLRHLGVMPQGGQKTLPGGERCQVSISANFNNYPESVVKISTILLSRLPHDFLRVLRALPAEPC